MIEAFGTIILIIIGLFVAAFVVVGLLIVGATVLAICTGIVVSVGSFFRKSSESS